MQYLFEIQGAGRVIDSNWIEPDPNLGSDADPNYQFTGLRSNTQYSVRYKARDKASGPARCRRPSGRRGYRSRRPCGLLDVTPPQPNPMTWDAPTTRTGLAGWGGKPFTIAIDTITMALG